MTKTDRKLLMDLADWCENFFDSPDGMWAQDAAQVLRQVTKSKPSREKAESLRRIKRRREQFAAEMAAYVEREKMKHE